MKTLITMFQGLCMATADSVPGVSGGTIAFIMGFYDKFINSLDNVLKGSKQERKEAVIFLAKLFGGWIIGFISCVLILSKLFESHVYVLCSAFLGLTVFAIPLVIYNERETLKGKYYNIVFTAIGAFLVFIITYLKPADSAVDLTKLTPLSALYLFVIAMIAICAMVLPGISGSTLLLIFGVYLPIINGIKEFLHFNFSYFLGLFIFGLGMIVGIFSTIKAVKTGLTRFRSQTVYFIIGLMIGSLYAIVNGPATMENPQPAMTPGTFNIIAFAAGVLVLVGLESVKHIKAEK